MKDFLFTQISEEYKINVIIKKVKEGGIFTLPSTKYYVSI
jgi:hypothetical protein